MWFRKLRIYRGQSLWYEKNLKIDDDICVVSISDSDINGRMIVGACQTINIITKAARS